MSIFKFLLIWIGLGLQPAALSFYQQPSFWRMLPSSTSAAKGMIAYKKNQHSCEKTPGHGYFPSNNQAGKITSLTAPSWTKFSLKAPSVLHASTVPALCPKLYPIQPFIAVYTGFETWGMNRNGNLSSALGTTAGPPFWSPTGETLFGTKGSLGLTLGLSYRLPKSKIAITLQTGVFSLPGQIQEAVTTTIHTGGDLLVTRKPITYVTNVELEKTEVPLSPLFTQVLPGEFNIFTGNFLFKKVSDDPLTQVVGVNAQLTGGNVQKTSVTTVTNSHEVPLLQPSGDLQYYIPGIQKEGATAPFQNMKQKTTSADVFYLPSATRPWSGQIFSPSKTTVLPVVDATEIKEVVSDVTQPVLSQEALEVLLGENVEVVQKKVLSLNSGLQCPKVPVISFIRKGVGRKVTGLRDSKSDNEDVITLIDDVNILSQSSTEQIISNVQLTNIPVSNTATVLQKITYAHYGHWQIIGGVEKWFGGWAAGLQGGYAVHSIEACFQFNEGSCRVVSPGPVHCGVLGVSLGYRLSPQITLSFNVQGHMGRFSTGVPGVPGTVSHHFKWVGASIGLRYMFPVTAR